jgi:cytosine deaminase
MSDVLIPKSLLKTPSDFDGVVQGDCLRGDPIWQDGRLTRLNAPTGGAVQILIPKLTEAHCHLDKCHTLPRLKDVGGDLSAAIAAQMQDKAHWSAKDLRERAGKALAELDAAGVAHIRSHIDWGNGADPPRSWSWRKSAAAIFLILADFEHRTEELFWGFGRLPAHARRDGAVSICRLCP